jgi:hypothetical protein
MNSSAKVTIAFLAAAALGAAVFTGCTTNDTTTPPADVDSGTDQGSTSSGGTDTGSTDDSGAAAVPVGTGCADNQQKEGVVSVDCQTCLETKCCDQLKGCFNIPVEAGTTDKVDCDTYATCVSDCNNDADPDTCVTTQCDPVAQDGIPDAYSQIITCASDPTNECATACGFDADAGM